MPKDSAEQMFDQVLRILVVDEDSESFSEIKDMLSGLGPACLISRVSSVSNGLKAVDSFRPDVIILESSACGSLESCRHFRVSSHSHNEAPVILVSRGKISSDEIADGLEAGADDYLAGPFGGRELVARVTRLAKSRQDQMRALEREAGMRTAFEHAPDGIFVMEGDQYVIVNKRALEVFGCDSVEDFAGKTLWDFSAKKQPDGQRSNVKAKTLLEGLSPGKTEHLEWLHRRRDGTVFPAEISLSVVEVLGRSFTQAIVRDVSERERLANGLLESQRRLALATEAAGIGIWEWDILNDAQNWDERTFRLYGVDEIPEEYGVDYWRKFLHPEDKERALKVASAALKNDRQCEFEYRVIWPDQTVHWIQGNGIVIRDKSGQPTRMLGTNYDITERKLAEEALRESEERLRRIMTNAQDMIFLVSLEDGFYEYVNEAAREITGFSSEMWMRTPFLIREILHPEWRDWFEDSLEKVRSGQIEPVYEFQIVHAQSGEMRWINQRNVLVTDDSGRPVAIEGLMTDVTDAKLVQEELRAANNAKVEFLAVMSHELRTPLNPILGLSSLLLESASGNDAEMLGAIKDSGERLLELVESLLDFVRLDRESVQPASKPFGLLDACNAAFNEVSREPKSVPGFFHNGDTDLFVLDEALEVVSDRGVLIRLLSILLENAYKYTDEGSVSFTVGQTKKGRVSEFCFIVRDTGIGMDEALSAKLFEPFTQADSSYKRAYQGAGLGLAICRKLVGLLNGGIEVSSKLGEGACFTVTLPFEVRSEEDFAASRTLDAALREMNLPRPLRVLVVDDDPASATMAEAMVQRMGGVGVVANGGAEAIDRCRREFFDAILIDLRMPEVNGFEASESIRKSGQLNEHTPIIAATADVTQENENRCLEIGMAGFLRKPVRIEELFAELIRVTAD